MHKAPGSSDPRNP